MTNARTVQRPVALAIRRKVHPGHGGWGNRPLRAATNCGWEHSRGCYLGESPRITPMATRRRPWPWWLGALARRTPEATFCKFCGFCGEVLERLIAFAIGSFTVLVCPSQIGRTTVLEHPRAPRAFSYACTLSDPQLASLPRRSLHIPTRATSAGLSRVAAVSGGRVRGEADALLE